jgi:molybdenum cofactor biosynthesis enzyme MoaA
MAALFAARGITLHLHTSGVLLERFAPQVAQCFARVIVSLDAADEARYRAIRGVAALQTLERGVARLRSLDPALPVTVRTTLHRMNFRDLPRIVEHVLAQLAIVAPADLPAILALDLEARRLARSAIEKHLF